MQDTVTHIHSLVSGGMVNKETAIPISALPLIRIAFFHFFIAMDFHPPRTD